MFSGKTTRKHFTTLLGKTEENLFCVFQEYIPRKDNVFTKETVGIKDFFFPWKIVNETGFLFWMQTNGIILLDNG